MLRFKSLGSGSSGNATIVQAGNAASLTHVLIDCGLSIYQLDVRLGQAGMQAEQIDAIFITHEHADHIGCAYQLALRERIPIWMSHGTYAAVGQPDLAGLLHIACDGTTIDLGALQLSPFTVPHDAREPLQLTCTDGLSKLGLLTDLGHATRYVLERLAGCHSVLLECNHDPDLLASSNYPAFLKRRIGGSHGHLANHAAAAIAQAIQPHGLQQIVAAHLSEQNNRPLLAQQALATALNCEAADIEVADAQNGSRWLSC